MLVTVSLTKERQRWGSNGHQFVFKVALCMPIAHLHSAFFLLPANLKFKLKQLKVKMLNIKK